MALGFSDTTIVGGGIVGLSVALGLLRAGCKVTVMDGPDGDFRASQGNFGLVWLQGKGAHFPPYARWTSDAIAQWPEFARELETLSRERLHLEQPGGYEFFTDVDEFTEFSADIEAQRVHLGNDLPVEFLSGEDLRRRFSGIGNRVVGATYCARDGHVNPLKLLSALRRAVRALGGNVHAGPRVLAITPQTGGGFEMTRENGETQGAERVILCAGLGAMTLAGQLGFATQVRPQRGELLITERVQDRLPFLSSTIRHVNEGGIQIGGTKAEAGLEDSSTHAVTMQLARHAVDVWPALGAHRIVRSWGALRVMTPDGYPVYAQSQSYPGAYFVTCHSGVTLASAHVNSLPAWIENTAQAPDLEAFHDNRISIPQVA